MTDDELRAAYAVHLQREADRPGAAPCVSPEALLGLVRREGPESERLAVLDHVMGCARCRAEFDLLRAVTVAAHEAEDEAARPEPGAASPVADRGNRADVRPLRIARPRRRWAGAIGLALAASVVLAVGVRQFRAHGDAVPADVDRGADDGVTLVAPAAGATVPAEVRVRLVWRRVPGATRYAVELLAPDGAAVVSTTTADTVLDATARLIPGAAYGWWVRAVGEDGSVVQRSGVRELHVAPP